MTVFSAIVTDDPLTALAFVSSLEKANSIKYVKEISQRSQLEAETEVEIRFNGNMDTYDIRFIES